MVVRTKGKSNKMRASRTHGWGSPKKHRGSGSRGGVGNAGRGKKGQQMMTLMHNIGFKLGKSGFVKPPSTVLVDKTINIGLIDSSIQKFLDMKIAKKTKDAVEINVSSLGCTKVLGSGNVATKLVVVAKKFSSNAKAKIEAAGGEAKLIESDVGEADKTANSSQAGKEATAS